MEEIIGEPPCLLISHGEHREKQTFYSLSKKRFRTKIIPELTNKCILASAYGWLVLVDHDTSDCCLWNISSSEIIELPILGYKYDKCILTKPPRDPDCRIVFISNCRQHIAFLQVGDDEYVVKSLEEQEEGEYVMLGAVAYQGEIYCHVREYDTSDPFQTHFVKAHFVGKTLEWIQIFSWSMRLLPILGGDETSYLTKSACGHDLLLVCEIMRCSQRHDDGLTFRIFRVDIDNKECVELENIGDQTLILSHQIYGGCINQIDINYGVCFSSAKGGTKPNSIYYTIPNSKNLYIYDLDTRRRSMLLPCPAARRSRSTSYWVEHQISHKFKT